MHPINMRQRQIESQVPDSSARMPFPGTDQLGVMKAFEFALLLWNFYFIEVPHGMLGNKTVPLYLPKEKDHVLKL